MICLKFGQIIIYLPAPIVDEVSRELWQLVAVIHDKVDMVWYFVSGTHLVWGEDYFLKSQTWFPTSSLIGAFHEGPDIFG